MSQVIEEEKECAICLEVIGVNTNFIKTKCGHDFHASCLMENVAHNGFNCPNCRTEMAKDPNEEDSQHEYDEWSGNNNVADEHALRGMRMLFQRAEGEQVEEDDNPDEEDELEDFLSEDEEEDEHDLLPPAEVIAEKLTEKGVTYLELVRSLISSNDEEYEFDQESMLVEGRVFGKICAIKKRYRKEELRKREAEEQVVVAARRQRINGVSSSSSCSSNPL
jgi:hypothetical protein